MARKDQIQGTLNVSGEGQITAKPDVASVRLAVVTEGKTASEAVGSNAEIAERVVAAIEKLGVSRDDMKTVGLNIYPVYETDEKTNMSRISGFRAENSIVVTAAVALGGKVFDAGVGAGANESSGISFGLRDERPYREKALAAAVEAANSEAGIVAEAMGVNLRGPKTIDIDQGSGPIVMKAAFESRSATPVMSGDLTISARVRVSFEYRT